MRKILFGGLVIVGALTAALLGPYLLWPSGPDKKPALAEVPPLQPVTRTSVVIAPTAIALTAIRDAMEAQAPRDLSGKRDNPVGQLLTNAELGWTVTRGPLVVTGRAEGLGVAAPLNGAFRLTGQIGAQVGTGVGQIAGALGGLLGDSVGQQMQNLTGRAFDQRADVRGNVAMTARPALLPNWRLEPNLTGQVNIGDVSLSIVGVKLNVSREIKPLLDRSVADQVAALQSRIRGDPVIEVAARREWTKMCRAFPVGKVAPGMPDLWLEIRPVGAVAAQPKIDANAVTLTVGVQAETRVVTAETKPDCPFPATIEIVAPMEQGRVSIGVPIDVPFTEVNRLIEAQLKGRTFPEGGSSPADVTVQSATVAPSGDRLLISLRVKAREKKSWFGLGAEAMVHVWGKPVLDRENQILRLTEIELDIDSDAAFGLIDSAARAAAPYLKPMLAEKAVVDLKPFAADARKKIETVLADFQKNQSGVKVETKINALRLESVAFDAKTLRVVAEAEGNLTVAVTSLSMP
jgi:hypothetical protein